MLLFISHYIEDEARGFLNGQGQIGWPDEGRIRDIRYYIMKISSSLEHHRQAWAAQVLQDEAKAEEHDKIQAQKALRIMRERGLLEEALAQNEKLAKELLNKGSNETLPELPEGFGVKVKVSKQKVEENVENKHKLWQQEQLQVMDEENQKKKKEDDEGKEDKKEDEGKEDEENKQDQGKDVEEKKG